MDLTDPDLRRLTQAVLTSNERAVTGLLHDAVAAGELRNLDPDALALAPVLLTVAQGSLLSWAVHRKGSARAWARRHVETALRRDSQRVTDRQHLIAEQQPLGRVRRAAFAARPGFPAPVSSNPAPDFRHWASWTFCTLSMGRSSLTAPAGSR